MSRESRKKKLQEAGKSHFLFSFSWLSRQPAWKEKHTGRGPMGVSQRDERGGLPPWPLLCLRFTQASWKSKAWSKFHTHETKVLPGMTLRELGHARTSAPLCLCIACSFCWAGSLSSAYLVICLSQLKCTPSVTPSATLFTQVPSKALGESLHLGQTRLSP